MNGPDAVSGAGGENPRPARRDQHRTLVDTATARLHEAILTGELAAGTALRLNEMADLLGMSMSPVRESIRRLAALGLVEIVPHKGAWVVPLSVDDAVDTYEARMALESVLTERAARWFTAQDDQRARAALDEHVAAARRGDAAAARLAHTEYHFTIYNAARSRWLLRGLEPVWENSERYRFATVMPDGSNAERLREHLVILDACAANDTQAAVLAVRRHIQHATDHVIAKMTAATEDGAHDGTPASG